MKEGVLAIDFGAGSGRGILFCLEGGKLQEQEVHRFSNAAVVTSYGWFWDAEKLMAEAVNAIRKGAQVAHVTAVGIDTWGVDYGWVDGNGKLSRPVYHYRDGRTDNASRICDVMSDWEQFQIAGIAPCDFNTDYQLWAESKTRRFVPHETLLPMPNLIGWYLTGERATEPTIASTTGFYKKDKGFDPAFAEKIGLPLSCLPEVRPTGALLGRLKKEIARQAGVDYEVPVYLCPGHDTAAAVLGVPAEGHPLFLSSGTWSLFGAERTAPLITPEAFGEGYTNELGYGGSVRFLKNIMGMWLMQECRRVWAEEGKEYSWEQLNALAEAAPDRGAYIDVTDARFNRALHMPDEVRRAAAERTGIALQSTGEIARCILESLALEYRYAYDGLRKLTNEKYPCLYIIGGGSQNALLNRLSANALGVPVSAGPKEATAIGNAVSLYLSLGVINTAEEGRKLIGATYPPKLFLPEEDVEEKVRRYRQIKG